MEEGYKYGVPFRGAKKVMIGGETVINVEEKAPKEEEISRLAPRWHRKMRV